MELELAKLRAELAEAKLSRQQADKETNSFCRNDNSGQYVNSNQGYGSPRQDYNGTTRGPTREFQPSPRTPNRCWVCSQPGHVMRNCPVAQDARCDTSPAGGPPSDYRISGMMESDVSSKQTRKSYLEVKINGNVCHALLDTGSYVTVLPRYLVTGCLIRLTKHRVRVLNKTTVPVQGEVLALIETPKFKSAAVGVVSECIN